MRRDPNHWARSMLRPFRLSSRLAGEPKRGLFFCLGLKAVATQTRFNTRNCDAVADWKLLKWNGMYDMPDILDRLLSLVNSTCGLDRIAGWLIMRNFKGSSHKWCKQVKIGKQQNETTNTSTHSKANSCKAPLRAWYRSSFITILKQLNSIGSACLSKAMALCRSPRQSLLGPAGWLNAKCKKTRRRIINGCKVSFLSYLLSDVESCKINTETPYRITSHFFSPEIGRDQNAKQPPHFMAARALMEEELWEAQQADRK